VCIHERIKDGLCMYSVVMCTTVHVLGLTANHNYSQVNKCMSLFD
jgi:hypothetical protein